MQLFFPPGIGIIAKRTARKLKATGQIETAERAGTGSSIGIGPTGG